MMKMSKADYIGTDEFRMAMPIEKAFEKEVDGNTRLYIAGLASGTTVDLDEERMAESAIHAFQKAIEDGITLEPSGVWSLIPLRSGHRKEWDDILGWVVKAEVDDKKQLWIEAELANTSAARDLYTVLTEPQRHGRPVQLGFSVGGKIKKASREWNQERNKSIRVLEEIALGEISVTGRPAFAPSYVEALTKSVNWDKVPLTQQEVANNPALKESIMEKDVQQVDTGSTTNATAQNTDAAAENANAQVPPVNNPTLSDTPGSDAAQVQGAPQNGNADVANLTQQVQSLTQTVQNLQTTVQTLANSDKSAEKPAQVATVTPDANAEKSVDIAALLANAFASFKTDTIDPLLTELQTVKSSVAEIAGQPVDKSLSVRRSKEVETAVEKFHEEVKANKNISPIATAVRLAVKE